MAGRLKQSKQSTATPTMETDMVGRLTTMEVPPLDQTSMSEWGYVGMEGAPRSAVSLSNCPIVATEPLTLRS